MYIYIYVYIYIYIWNLESRGAPGGRAEQLLAQRPWSESRPCATPLCAPAAAARCLQYTRGFSSRCGGRRFSSRRELASRLASTCAGMLVLVRGAACVLVQGANSRDFLGTRAPA